MLVKKQLHELSIITGTIDNISAVNIDMLKNHVLSNWTLNNRLTDNDYKYDMITVKFHIINIYNGCRTISETIIE